MRRFWPAEAGIFLGIWLILMIAGRSQLLRDPGTFWHTVVGERILSTGSLIRADPFSFTRAGTPWISRQWLCEVAMALIHRIAGLDGLLLATVMILAGLYTWVAHRLIRSGIHWLLAVLIVTVAMSASSFHFHPRPHLVSIALLGWTFARLSDFEAGRVPLGRLFWFIPLFIIWANAHDGVLGGLATLALVASGWVIVWLIRRGGPLVHRHQILVLGILVVACVLAVLVNPFGLDLPRTWVSLLGSPVLPEVMDEHGPLLSRPYGVMVLPMGLLFVAAFAGTLPRPRITWYVPLVWLALTFSRIRHGPLFVITAALALGEMLPNARWFMRLARSRSELFRLRTPAQSADVNGLELRPILLPGILVLTALLLQSLGVPFPVLGCGWARLDPTHWPTLLLPELKGVARDRPPGTPIFNEMLDGGFLIYHTPRLRVFIDDRCELYGDRMLLDYARAEREEPARIEEWARNWGFALALTRQGSGFDHHFSRAPGWQVIRRAGAASLYGRRSELPTRPPSDDGTVPPPGPWSMIGGRDPHDRLPELASFARPPVSHGWVLRGSRWLTFGIESLRVSPRVHSGPIGGDTHCHPGSTPRLSPASNNRVSSQGW
jgi:hypothetical protein